MALFEHIQDVIGQLPILKSYSHILICFSVSDDKRETAVRDIELAVRQVMKTLPFLAGKVINEGSDERSSGTFKVARCERWESPNHTFVRVEDRSTACVPYDELCAAHGPSTMLPGNLLSLRKGFPESYEETEDDPAPVLDFQANIIRGGLLLDVAAQHNIIDGTGVFQIVNLLATALRGEPIPQFQIDEGNRDRRSLIALLGPDEPLLDHGELKPAVIIKAPPPPELLASFKWRYYRFSVASVNKIRDLANSRPEDFHPSTTSLSLNDAITAFCWQRIIAVRLKRLQTPAAISKLSRAVDFRRVMKLSPAYLGHMVRICNIRLTFQEVIDSSLSRLAALLRKAILDISNEYALRSYVTFVANESDKSDIAYGGSFNPQTDFSCSSVAHVKVPDFGPMGQPDKNLNDAYAVSTLTNGTIHVEGSTLSALATGLHRYLTDVVHVDIYWFVGSRLHTTPKVLPTLNSPLKGRSIVPWRYHLNPVTFSYTTAFWTWEDWELELDWAALRGVNLILAWTGYEKVLLDSLRDVGLSDSDILHFFSGPAFQAWNRMGNIQGSWGPGRVSIPWLEAQFDLQKKIVARIVELGMTPVLPGFSGFVPSALRRVKPHAGILDGEQWSGFPPNLTEVSFLSPLDETFTELQKSIIHKQISAFGNITNIYAIDQFNEMNPPSGDPASLHNLSYHTWRSLKQASPSSIWLMQGWLFYNNRNFWNLTRISSYLDGVQNPNDMLILDLYSESQPQWQRTRSYFGKPWIWCQLHDFGGSMGMYGQIMNVTINPIEALNKSDSLVGFGLTMEAQEGNEIVYDLLLDQAWSATPIDTRVYVRDWVSRRYAGNGSVPRELYKAWDMLRTTVYNNTNLTTNAVTKSIFELSPDVEGLVGRTGHYPTATTVTYDPVVLTDVWGLFLNATKVDPGLWQDPVFRFDFVDVTRQVMGNAFVWIYSDLVQSWNSRSGTTDTRTKGRELLEFLNAIDRILSCDRNFSLSSWIAGASMWGNSSSSKDVFEYNARNQVTLWGPTGEISDYASKAWAGLISSYYVPRWSIFVDYLGRTNATTFNRTEVQGRIREFEMSWQVRKADLGISWANGSCGGLEGALRDASQGWPSVFNIE
ncbi:hypothetical protein BBP40_002039 [Aspergillus hancockii]|nr:hypothetical protein BBP40_002039 [Aspergillus hancockii]